jgi:hypothetical protein
MFESYDFVEPLEGFILVPEASGAHAEVPRHHCRGASDQSWSGLVYLIGRHRRRLAGKVTATTRGPLLLPTKMGRRSARFTTLGRMKVYAEENRRAKSDSGF